MRALGGHLDIAELNIVGLVRDLGKVETSVVHASTHTSCGSATNRFSRFGLEDIQEPAVPFESVKNQDHHHECASCIEARMLTMETRMSGLLAKNDERAIRFADLGFQTIVDLNAWLETEL